MKPIYVIIGTLTSTSAAFAGGYNLPVTQPEPAVTVISSVETETDWTGGYLGLQFGKGRQGTDVPAYKNGSIHAPKTSQESEPNAYGVHAGYMHDFGKIVAGGELDYNKITSDKHKLSYANVTENVAEKLDSKLLRVRGRVGFDGGKWMPYATLGVARTLGTNGVTYGGGLEFKVTEKVTLGGEITRQTFKMPVGSPNTNSKDKAKVDLDLAQIRATYRF